MRAAFLCHLTRAWTADRYPQAQRDARPGAADRAWHPRSSPRAHHAHRAHRARALPAGVARLLRTVLGGGP